jgi:hypothetical protein
MKHVLLITFILISTIFMGISCDTPTATPTDTSKYTYDQVLIVAQNISPYCRKQTVSGSGSG